MDTQGYMTYTEELQQMREMEKKDTVMQIIRTLNEQSVNNQELRNVAIFYSSYLKTFVATKRRC